MSDSSIEEASATDSPSEGLTLPHDDLAVTTKASVVQSSSTCVTSLPGCALLPVTGLLDIVSGRYSE